MTPVPSGCHLFVVDGSISRALRGKSGPGVIAGRGRLGSRSRFYATVRLPAHVAPAAPGLVGLVDKETERHRPRIRAARSFTASETENPAIPCICKKAARI